MNEQLHTGRITQKQQKGMALCPLDFGRQLISPIIGYWVNMMRYSGAMMERLLINANATTTFSLQAHHYYSWVTTTSTPLCVDANMMTGLPSHANLGSCSNSY